MKLSPDAPIELPSQDRLGRRHFAAALAKAVRNWRTNSSLVIGLFGGWGCGKSSIKNLAIRSLSLSSKRTPLIIEFNPWLVSRQEQLVEAFFRDVSIAISRPMHGEKESKSAERLTKLATYFSAFGTATEHTMNVLAMAGVPGAMVGAKVAKGLSQASEGAKRAAEQQKQLVEAATKTLSELKEELRESLSQRADPILVVMDDIDRLTNDEICLLFRLIKANADFPKFVYLVLCDRSFVTSALESLAPSRGAEFLEKIVQVTFDIPDPDWNDLVRFAKAEWDSLVKHSPDAKRLCSLNRWNELISLSRPYLRHIRVVRRWMNAVCFSFDFFNKRGGFDANPEDLLALELLRVHEPALYERLGRSKVDLTGASWDIFRDQGSETKRAKLKEATLATVIEERRESAGAIIEWLFPNARWKGYSTDSSELLRNLRVGDARCFDRYFNFILKKEVFSRGDTKVAIEATASPDCFKSLVRNEFARGRLSALFDLLAAHVSEVVGNALAILDGMFSVGDELPDGKWVFGGEGLQQESITFVIELLSNIKDINTRSVLLIDAMERANGVMLPVFLFLYCANSEWRGRANEDCWLPSNEHLPRLKEATLSKIREFKESSLLRNADHVAQYWSRGGFAGPMRKRDNGFYGN